MKKLAQSHWKSFSVEENFRDIVIERGEKMVKF